MLKLLTFLLLVTIVIDVNAEGQEKHASNGFVVKIDERWAPGKIGDAGRESIIAICQRSIDCQLASLQCQMKNNMLSKADCAFDILNADNETDSFGAGTQEKRSNLDSDENRSGVLNAGGNSNNNNSGAEVTTNPKLTAATDPTSTKLTAKQIRESIDTAHWEEQARELQLSCRNQLNLSNECCGEPLSCLGSSDNASNVGGLTLTGLQLYRTIKGASAASPAESCRLMGQMSKISAGIQTATVAVCVSQKNVCSNICVEKKDKILAIVQECKTEANDRGLGIDDVNLVCGKIEDSLSRAERSADSCSGLTARATEQSLNAASSLMAVNLNKKCEESGIDPPEITGFVDPADCGKTENLNSPFCRAQACQQPGMEANPVCADFAAILSNDNSSNGDDDLSSGDGTPSLAGLDGDEDSFDQGFNPESVEGEANNFAGSSGGGGGGAGLGGGSSSSGGGGRGKAGTASAEKNNLKNLFRARKGSGFARGFASGGGYKGRNYGKASRRSGRTAGKKFNLKKYLPNGELYGKRKLASVAARAKSGIAGKHTSIWQNVSKKYVLHCRTKQLKGCK